MTPARMQAQVIRLSHQPVGLAYDLPVERVVQPREYVVYGAAVTASRVRMPLSRYKRRESGDLALWKPVRLSNFAHGRL
jgi:hypothetical protein